MGKKKEEVRIIYTDMPFATVSGYFNGDMFEDWLKTDEANDPHHKLKVFFRTRDRLIQKQVKDRIKKGIEQL